MRPSHVVGIGASAGGLDPLVAFFDNLPTGTGMAFVIVQHLSPDFKSVMDELLGRHTSLPIHLVRDGMPVEPDHVYLIPAKTEMIISGGKLLLTERDRQQELTLPIDVFFRSLAQDAGPRAVAIVLSGGGSDGSRGIRDVHDGGGMVLVQDAASAQFDGMPRAALETGVADHVAPPEAMPNILIDAIRGHRAAAASDAAEAAAEPAAAGMGFEPVYRMLQDEFGLDFTHYKPSTVTRRIERRLGLARSLDLDEYLRQLRSERAELDALYRDLLIGVTAFFRDPEAFALIENQVLPGLLSQASNDSPLRLWVAGCATGEEAYSLGIVVQDVLSRLGERPVKIFATDVHRGSLDRAAMAVYDAQSVANVSPQRLERYFIPAGDSYQVAPDLRQMVVFAQHDVIRDAPFTRIDLVTCRNLLIYLQPAAQQRVLSFFHFSLRQGGVLLLGPSEGLGPLARGFEVVDKRWQLYRKHGEVRTPVGTHRRVMTPPEPRLTAVPQTPPGSRRSLAHLIATYDALLEEAMPPSLLVSETGELVQAFGGASRFLTLRDGRQGLEVLDLVGSELKMVLLGALKKAMADSAATVYKGVRAGADGGEDLYRVTVRGVRSREGGPRHALISFEPMEASAAPPRAQTEVELDQVSRQQLAALESELGHTKESLQAAIEQLETSNEELQASNEELQASNEELQSTNEELQSVNEELYTVNAEYQRKISELTELTNDMDNLLASTDVGTIFLDAELRIRKFTPQVAATFSLVPHDVGRSIEAFAHKMDHPELVQDLKRVLATGQSIERDLAEVLGRSYFLRILPYRAKGTIAGVVLTLIDVTGLKAAEDALFHERYLLNSLLRTFPDAIYFKDAAGRFIRVNQPMAARLGLAHPAEAVGRTAFDIADRDMALALHRDDEAVLRSGASQHGLLQPRLGRDGSADSCDIVTRLPLQDRNGAIVGIIVIFRDVTEQKRGEAKITEAVRRRDQFLAMLSHELRNPLGAIVTAASTLHVAEPGGPMNGRAMDVISRQSRQMARLLDDLLEASRVTQNKIDLRKEVVDLGAIAREAADAIRAEMDERGLEFATHIDSGPMGVYGDPARLQQIHANLLSNAAKYTQRGGHVELRVRRDGADAVASVKDDGMGIGAEMVDSIFDLFVQGSRTLDRASGGLGVGLTLVRSLVTMHGGTVTAHSDGEGRGSEFVVRLPLATRTAEFPLPSVGTAPLAGAGARILVVEDNADSRDVLCALLQQAGFDCRTAATGRIGLEMLDEFRPAVVILDLGLPELDGLEVARQIRARPNHAAVRLIALTGYGQAADRAATLQAGFDAHLVKPAQAERLLALLGAELPPPHVPTVAPVPLVADAASDVAVEPEGAGPLN
jgi:two-component system CheB/CheR fusion protein